ncbi:MAG: OmpH family outer membrane protein [Verrucomicrobia bacterium]|nr:OmpH family outer membrane protein [Verrucomicrobiota bacterium]
MNLRLCLLSAGLLLVAPQIRAELKVGTFDLNRALAEFHKTRDAELRVLESRDAARKELDERLEQRRRLLEEIERLNRALASAPPSELEAKTKERDGRIEACRELERELGQLRQTRERELAGKSSRLRQGLVEEILRVVQEQVKQDGYDLVFDLSGGSFNGVPLLLSARPGFDFTATVVRRLNESRPKPEPAAKAESKRAPAAAATDARAKSN